MKAKMRCGGTSDGKAYNRGEILDYDSEGVRRLLVNRIATPEDADAEALLAKAAEGGLDHLVSPALQRLAADLDERDAAEAQGGSI